MESKRVVLVDIEALCESDMVALQRFNEKFGKERQLDETKEYPLKANFCATQGRQIEEVLLEVRQQG